MMVCLVQQSGKFHCWKASSTQTLLSKFANEGIKYECRLKEVIYAEDKLYLIFEYCDYDLKKYIRHIGGPLK